MKIIFDFSFKAVFDENSKNGLEIKLLCQIEVDVDFLYLFLNISGRHSHLWDGLLIVNQVLFSLNNTILICYS